jgi:hypothetical protein
VLGESQNGSETHIHRFLTDLGTVHGRSIERTEVFDPDLGILTPKPGMGATYIFMREHDIGFWRSSNDDPISPNVHCDWANKPRPRNDGPWFDLYVADNGSRRDSFVGFDRNRYWAFQTESFFSRVVGDLVGEDPLQFVGIEGQISGVDEDRVRVGGGRACFVIEASEIGFPRQFSGDFRWVKTSREDLPGDAFEETFQTTFEATHNVQEQ